MKISSNDLAVSGIHSIKATIKGHLIGLIRLPVTYLGEQWNHDKKESMTFQWMSLINEFQVTKTVLYFLLWYV